MGKDGPDPALEIVRRLYTHKATGDTVQLPEGVGYGWDYQPGNLWEKELVPSALIDDPLSVPTPDLRGQHLVSIDTSDPIESLLAKSLPFEAKKMAPGLDVEDYVAGFLDTFDLNLGQARLWEDVAGGRVLISDQLFRNSAGDWKGGKARPWRPCPFARRGHTRSG